MSVYKKPSTSEACNRMSNLIIAGCIGIIKNQGLLLCSNWIEDLALD